LRNRDISSDYRKNAYKNVSSYQYALCNWL
jgi:hypothetical protein